MKLPRLLRRPSPVKRQKLYLKRFAFIVEIYHRTLIPRFEPLFGNALFHYDAIMLLDIECSSA
jgi:hypothetical protein